MANPEHLEILKQGVWAWNQWRKDNPKTIPSLRGADLRGAILSGYNLTGAHLIVADLTGASLNHADLVLANLCSVELARADLTGASLRWAELRRANLKGTCLAGASLLDVNLSGATLIGADLHGAEVGSTVFADVDLSAVDGLDAMKHLGPSGVGVETLYRSRGRIPDKFLRDAGVPEEIIEICRSIRAGPAIQWHSCFISHATKDEEFARRLHGRMREAGMRVWFAPDDMKGGDTLYAQIDRAIQVHDKLLLVLSENSIKSDWVITEIRNARKIEKKEERRKLFPIRLADFETLRDWTCFDTDSGKDLAVEVREYFIPDFSNWKDHDAFEVAFGRLQKDLKAEEKLPPSKL